MTDRRAESGHSDYLGPNARALVAAVRHQGDGDIAEEIGGLAGASGPLNACLSRVCDEFGTTVSVIASFVHLARRQQRTASVVELTATLDPLLRWDYGAFPIQTGLRNLDDCAADTAAELGRLLPGRCGDLLWALWLDGMHTLAHEPGDASAGLLSHSRRAMEVFEHASIQEVGREFFERVWETEVPNRPAPKELMSAPWVNAITMLRRHGFVEDGHPGVLRRLLACRHQGLLWPMPDHRNEAFVRDAAAKGLSGFWSEHTATGGTCCGLTTEFVVDPLEMLNLGNAFDTCTQIGQVSETKALGYAANASTRVAAVRARDGHILGRRAIGLSLTDHGGIVQSPTYPVGDMLIASLLDEFVAQFSGKQRLRIATNAEVCDTCAPFYHEFQILAIEEQLSEPL